MTDTGLTTGERADASLAATATSAVTLQGVTKRFSGAKGADPVVAVDGVDLEGLGVAVTRRVPGETDGQVLHPSERITRDEALGAYTAGVAYQAGDEHEAGIIAVGSRADLVLTGADVTRVPDDVLGQIPVRRTWRSGSTVSGD